MTTAKTQIRTPDGKIVDVTEVDFKIEDDPETRVSLSDGSLLRIKVLVTNVSRLEGVHDVITGDPLYFVQTQPVIRVKADPKLKKLK